MAPTSLVRRAHDLSQALKTALQLTEPADPLQLKTRGSPPSSFLFEMVVLHALLRALIASGWSITPVLVKGQHRFARSPGKKGNYTFFHIRKGDTRFQVVHGTKIRDRYERRRAPDISLQEAEAPLDPSPAHLNAIWDAKLRGRTGEPCDTRIADGEFRSFLAMMDWLEVPRPSDEAAQVLAEFPPAFGVSGLLTNGRAPEEPPRLFFDEGVSVCERFTGADTPSLPSRGDHLNAADDGD